ncbi:MULTISPECIES: hypothetical protein [unclassified Arthrobacter]|uniref:hypothetical protein n=1 Tax=unclassified Arthrobacter TaxID=235627 RepID=UPI00159E8379|nr:MULTISPECIES: hypothetical protein [unclassified Arthrobacter]MCQ9164784.1 hypothetical protein [Arthrobacter sp. STN4]NVM98768.1 hypothetical protein [Arthrobacter sp. SDTb3-6]
MSTNGFGHPPVSSNDAASLREPMPWMSRRRTGGAYRLPGLQYPLGSLSYGVVLIALGIVALVATADAGALAAGIPIFLIAAGLGLWLAVVGAVRWPWYRKYVRQHGHPPF